MGLLRNSLTPLVRCCTVVMLASCANQNMVAAFQTRSQTIALRQAHNDGGYFISISPRTVLPLEGYTSAHIESVWDTQSGRLVIVSGANAICPVRYTVIVATREGTSLRPIGECGEAYEFVQDGGIFAIRYSGSRERKSWFFKDGVLRGPIIEHVRRLKVRAKTPHAAEVSEEPTSPPPVSTPVGDEVIPAPVTRSGRTRSTSDAQHS